MKGTSGQSDELSFIAILSTVLRSRRLVVGCALGLALVVTAGTLVWPRTFTVSTAFIPQASRKSSSGLSGIAAQVGLLLPGADASASPEFYVSLLQTREILDSAVASEVVTSDGRTLTLARFLGARGASEAVQVSRAIQKLRRNLSVTSDARAGMVRLSVKLRDPQVANDVSVRLLSLVNTFNLNARQSQATAERKFTESRLVEVSRDLRLAEDELQAFLQRNREYRSSPVLQFEEQRLQELVARQRRLRGVLQESFEQARIEEVRDTPVTTVVEHPYVPVLADPRAVLLKAIIALFAGLILGTGLALAGDMARPEGGRGDVAELKELWGETLSGIRAWVPFRRTVRNRT